MERQVRRRRRAAFSCIECRRRKVKCDKAEPCAHCVAMKTQCIYQTFGHSPVPRSRGGVDRGRNSSSTPHGDAFLSPARATVNQGLEDDEPGQLHDGGLPLTPNSSVQRNATAPTATRGASSGEGLDVITERLTKRIQVLEGSLVTGTPIFAPELSTIRVLTESKTQKEQVPLNKTRVTRWSSMLSNAPEFADVFGQYSKALGGGPDPGFPDQGTEARITQLGELLVKCKQVARVIKLGRPSRSLISSMPDLSPPSREVADRMMTLYFRSFESIYRILHIPTFREMYKNFWEQPDSATMDTSLQILLVIAIGSSLSGSEPVDTDFRQTTHQWVYAAQTWLCGGLEKDRLNLAGLQLYCLVILAREALSLGGDLIWMSMGSLLHRAMQMGLHRDPETLPPMSLLQAELRRRLWATVLEMLIQSSLDAALPPRLSLHDFDTRPPANVKDDELSENTKELRPHPRNVCTTTSLQLELLDSVPTRLNIVQLLNGINNNISYSEALSLNSEIDKACRHQSNFLLGKDDFGYTAFHRNLVDYLVRRFVIPLHCPFVSKARREPEYYFSRKTRIDAAMAILSPEPDEDHTRLMTVGGGVFREGIRCACTVISLEFLAHIEKQRQDGTLWRNSQYRDMLKGFLEGLLELSVERIRQGETNIKMHPFLSMILAYGDAVQSNTEIEPKVTLAAKESFELCYELLNQRATAVSIASVSSTDFFDIGPELQGFDFDLDFFFANPSPP